jgi:hypothetical protein
MEGQRMFSKDLGLSGRMKIPRMRDRETGTAATSVKNCQLLLGRMIQAKPVIKTEPPVQKYPIEDKIWPLACAGISSARRSKGITTPPIPIPQRVRQRTRVMKFGEKALAVPAMMIVAHAIEINKEEGECEREGTD